MYTFFIFGRWTRRVERFIFITCLLLIFHRLTDDVGICASSFLLSKSQRYVFCCCLSRQTKVLCSHYVAKWSERKKSWITIRKKICVQINSEKKLFASMSKSKLFYFSFIIKSIFECKTLLKIDANLWDFHLENDFITSIADCSPSTRISMQFSGTLHMAQSSMMSLIRHTQKKENFSLKVTQKKHTQQSKNS